MFIYLFIKDNTGRPFDSHLQHSQHHAATPATPAVPSAKPRLPRVMASASSDRGTQTNHTTPEGGPMEETREEEAPETDQFIDPEDEMQDRLAESGRLVAEAEEEEQPLEDDPLDADHDPEDVYYDEDEDELDSHSLMQQNATRTTSPTKRARHSQVTEAQAIHAMNTKLLNAHRASQQWWAEWEAGGHGAEHTSTGSEAQARGHRRRRHDPQEATCARWSPTVGIGLNQWSWEEEEDLLQADHDQAIRDDEPEADFASWQRKQEEEQDEVERQHRGQAHTNADQARLEPQQAGNQPRPTTMLTICPDVPPTPPATGPPVIDLDADSTDENTTILQAVREWEAEHGPMEQHVTTQSDTQLDVLTLMQAVDPVHATIQTLQNSLEQLPRLGEALVAPAGKLLAASDTARRANRD